MADPMLLLGRVRSFMSARVLLTAAELDLFSALADKPQTAASLATERGLHERPLRMVLDALVGLEVLSKRHGVYACLPDAEQYLTRDAPESVLPMLLHNARLWDAWSGLTDRVQRTAREASDSREDFIGAMHVIARGQASALVDAIEPGPARHLLDVGGASGTYTEAFLRAVPELRATLFDQPPVIELARQRLAPGLLDRVELAAGDLRVDPLPPGHDLALVSAIIHMLGLEELTPFFSKVRAALVPGGRIVVRDFVMSADRTEPAAGALFALNMLVNTPAGDTYTMREIREALEAAGFERIRLFAPADTMNALVEGYVPQ